VVIGAVARELEGVVDELGRIVAGIDAGSLLATEAVDVLAQLDALKRLVAGGELKVAARAAEAQFWKSEGKRSAAEWLATRSGCGLGQARGLLGASEKLNELPRVAEAVGRGELSLDQAVAVADGAAANPAREGELLEVARGRSLQGLRDEVERTKQAAITDEAAQQRAIHRERRHRMWMSAGGVNWAGRGTADTGVRMKAALGPVCQAVYDDARRRGEHEDFDAYMADALLLAIEAGAAWFNGVPPPPSLRAGPETAAGRSDRTGPDADPGPELARAQPAGPGRQGAGVETGAGSAPPPDRGPTLFDAPPGPEPTAARTRPEGVARGPSPGPGAAIQAEDGADPPATNPMMSPLMARLLEHGHLRRRGGDHLKVIVRVDAAALDRGHTVEGEVCEVSGIGPLPVPAARALVADAALAVVLTRGTDVARVANLGRAPNALQKTVLQWRDPVCSVAGCTNAARLEADHIELWSRDGPTSLDNLELKCAFHHALKSRDGWTEAPGPAGTPRPLLPRPRARPTRDPGPRSGPGPAPSRARGPGSEPRRRSSSTSSSSSSGSGRRSRPRSGSAQDRGQDRGRGSGSGPGPGSGPGAGLGP
jgi:hypothetical protein